MPETGWKKMGKSERDRQEEFYYFNLNYSESQIKHEDNQILKPEELEIGKRYLVKRTNESGDKTEIEGLEITLIEEERFKALHFDKSFSSITNRRDDAWYNMQDYGIFPKQITNPEDGKIVKRYITRNYLVRV